MARHTKLLGTYSGRIDATDLHVAEADLVAVYGVCLMLLEPFVCHHTGGEMYDAFRTTALRWEQQQRAFAEFHPKNCTNWKLQRGIVFRSQNQNLQLCERGFQMRGYWIGMGLTCLEDTGAGHGMLRVW